MKSFTSSKATTIIGAAAFVFLGLTLLFGLVLSGPDTTQGNSARLLFIHVPSVMVAYTAFLITCAASIMYLRKRTIFWDLLAGSAGEIGVLFTAFVLITGSVWGKPTWNAYWVWDPRLTSTAVMFIMYLGYLALRSLDLPRETRSKRSAILGVVSLLNVIIVHYSVQWWRGIHQGQTLGFDPKIDAVSEEGPKLMGFSLFLGFVALFLVGTWLLMHRFRLAWLQYQLEQQNFSVALKERRAEAGLVDEIVDLDSEQRTEALAHSVGEEN